MTIVVNVAFNQPQSSSTIQTVKGVPGANGNDGREIQLNVSETHIQWRYVGETNWIDLIAKSELKGADGQKGEDGVVGADGQNGADGREIELENNGSFIRWRYVGETNWIDLIAKSELKGADGTNGKSAYQTWLELGNTGTEADFIASLQGSDGTDGAQIDDNVVSLLSTYSSNKIESIVGNIEAALDIILGE